MHAQQIQLQEEKPLRPAVTKKIEALGKEIEGLKTGRELKDFALFFGLLAASVLGRVALKYVPSGLPSVEPIIPFAVLAGLLFGVKEGFVLGSSAYVVSNFFVPGLQGPWTVFQALGAGLAGLFGGVHRGFGKPTGKALIALTVFGTLVFELIVNVSGGLLGIGWFTGLMGLPLFFLTSLPFSAVHTLTNAGFAAFLKPLLSLRKNDEQKFSLVSLTRAVNGKRLTVRMLKSNE